MHLRFIYWSTAVALLVLLRAPAAWALDCPCTWEQMLCETDAVAEVDVLLATKTSKDRMKDRMVVRRTIWNATKHRIQPMDGWTYIPLAIRPMLSLQHSLGFYRNEKRTTKSDAPAPEWLTRYRRAMRKGSYRSLVFLRYSQGDWIGGGAVMLDDVQWIDHPQHHEWWSALQPLLQERIRLAAEGKKPDTCIDLQQPTRFKRY